MYIGHVFINCIWISLGGSYNSYIHCDTMGVSLTIYVFLYYVIINFGIMKDYSLN